MLERESVDDVGEVMVVLYVATTDLVLGG